MIKAVLEGIRVVDWTIAQAGPKATVWLAALGAEVIHVEQAGVGDSQRYWLNLQGVPTMVGDGPSILFQTANFNKKSLTVNLRNEKGREIIYRLVERSDIFATNQLPDTIEKLGMDYETMVKHNPQIIYATNNVVGYWGPYRTTPGLDPLGQAVSGLMATSGTRGQPPTRVTTGTADLTAGIAMFSGMLAALLYRERTGQGQRVDTSQMQALMNVPLSYVLATYSVLSEEQRQANPYGGVCRANPRDDDVEPNACTYQCKDGGYVSADVAMDKHFTTLVRGMGRPELADDPRFAQAPIRAKNSKELIRILDEAFAQHTVKEWREQLQGLDISFYPLNDIPNLLEDPQVLANDMLFHFEHPKLNRVVKLAGMPFSLSKTPGRMNSMPPELGEHTEEVLLSLGYSWEDIAGFHEEGVI